MSQGQMRLAAVPRQLPPRLYRKLTSAYDRTLLVDPVRAPRSILVVRRDEIGDLAITLPLLARLRQVWPQARVTLLAGSVPGALLRGTALVDEVVVWPLLQRGPRPSISPLKAFRFARRLIRGRRRFDLALLPHRDGEFRDAWRVAALAARQIIRLDPRAWQFGAGRPGDVPSCPGPRRRNPGAGSPGRGGDPLVKDRHGHGRRPAGPSSHVGHDSSHRRISAEARPRPVPCRRRR